MYAVAYFMLKFTYMAIVQVAHAHLLQVKLACTDLFKHCKQGCDCKQSSHHMGMLCSVYLRGEVSRHVSLLQQYPLLHTHPTEQQPNDNNFTTTVAAS